MSEGPQQPSNILSHVHTINITCVTRVKCARCGVLFTLSPQPKASTSSRTALASLESREQSSRDSLIVFKQRLVVRLVERQPCSHLSTSVLWCPCFAQRQTRVGHQPLPPAKTHRFWSPCWVKPAPSSSSTPLICSGRGMPRLPACENCLSRRKTNMLSDSSERFFKSKIASHTARGSSPSLSPH